jgi:hypothetical protein
MHVHACQRERLSLVIDIDRARDQWPRRHGAGHHLAGSRAAGDGGGFGDGCDLSRIECAYLPVEGQAEEPLVKAGWQPCRGHGGVYLVHREARSVLP